MLDGFDGKLTNKKWAAIGKCSSDTALRDINDLIARGVLRRTETAGRNTSYELNSDTDAVRYPSDDQSGQHFPTAIDPAAQFNGSP